MASNEKRHRNDAIKLFLLYFKEIEMLKKFKGYKSKDEVIDLIIRAVGESHDWSIENNDIHSINIIRKRFLDNWFEENL